MVAPYIPPLMAEDRLRGSQATRRDAPRGVGRDAVAGWIENSFAVFNPGVFRSLLDRS